MPTPTRLDISADTTSVAVKEILTAKYADAGAWASWASDLLSSDIVKISNYLGSDTVSADLAAVIAAIGAIPSVNIPTISGGTGDFASGNSSLTALQSRIASDISAYSTGLGATVESAMFARETARENAQRAAAYNEVTTSFSSRGWDMPPGALLAKQTEINNESSIRLADSSGKILEESARLALDYNKHMMSVAIQLQNTLAEVFNSKEMRMFEASKASAMLILEGYKSTLGMYSVKAELLLKEAELVITNKTRQLQIEVSALEGLAQSAAQMVAAALNGVSVSSSIDFRGSATTSADLSNSIRVDYSAPAGTLPSPGISLVS